MRFLKKSGLLLLLLVISHQAADAQIFSKRKKRNEDPGDTIRGVILPEFTIKVSKKAYWDNYLQTEHYVLKCIALANFIRDISTEIDGNVADIDKKRSKKKYL